MTQVRARKRSRDKSQGFLDVPTINDIEGADKLTPADEVEAVLERYTGRPVSLDKLYPSPPPEPTGNPALDYQGAAPRRPEAIIREPQRDAIRTQEAYQKEYRLKTVHRFILRGASIVQIAQALGVDVAEAHRLRTELMRRISKEVSSIDFPAFVGMSMGFYQEVRSLALRQFDAGGEAQRDAQGNVTGFPMSPKDRMGYLSIAKGAEDSQHRLLQLAGFYDNVKLTPAAQSGDAATEDMLDMQSAMKMLLDPSAYQNAMEAVLNEDTGAFEVDAPEEDSIRVL